jgi:myo-inositol-1(or 4)-monophosphatase
MNGAVSDLDVALSAAKAGANVVRAAYGSEVGRHVKTGLDFATDADLDAERAMFEVIAASRPDDGRVGEESGSAGGDSDRRWLVDPLCGTLNFAAQTPLVAVNVALVDGAGALVAVSADPIADELFWCDRETAAVRRAGVDEVLRPSSASRLIDVNCDGPLDSPFVGAQLLGDPALRGSFGPRVVSTTLAVAWTAAGRRAGYVSDGTFVDNVHFAAGIALSRIAGCVVTDLTGEAVESGRGLIVAADVGTHHLLLEIVRPHLEAITTMPSIPIERD